MRVDRIAELGLGLAVVAGTYLVGQHEGVKSVLAGIDPRPKAPAAANGQPDYMNDAAAKAVLPAVLNSPLFDGGVLTATITSTVPSTAITKDGVTMTGVPERIDSGNVVDVAKGSFKNTLGQGTEAFLAEPGGLLVGPDFGSKSAKNPFGENPQGWDAMYDSEGAIRPFSPVSQEVLRYQGPAFQNLPEGGFVLISGGGFTARVGEAVFDFRPERGKNYFLLVRGRYADNLQDSDLNGTIEISNYKAGHVSVNMYESRNKTNTAFVSEGQFLQMAETSHSSGTNCGAEGCSRLEAVMYDSNTKAVTAIKQTKGRFEDPSKDWQLVFQNWRVR